jgi:hypothetical protein
MYQFKPGSAGDIPWWIGLSPVAHLVVMPDPGSQSARAMAGDYVLVTENHSVT